MTLKIAVLAVGDELINGEMSDTNTARIARVLARHGYPLRGASAVGDSLEDIADALRTLAKTGDVVIVTGGLGPTGDDLTAEGAALAFDAPLRLNGEALASIRDHFSRAGRVMHPRNEKQALLPEGADVLPNSAGTAPGFHLNHDGSDLYFLPGVPSEMETMLQESVLPGLLRSCKGAPPVEERIFRVFGLAEPRVEEILSLLPLPEGVSIAFGLDFPFVLAKVRGEGSEAAQRLEDVTPAVRGALGAHLVSEGEESLPQRVARHLTEGGTTLSLAESCTGGLVSAMLTEIPGSSLFLERGGVTYANTAKVDWLGVPEEVIEKEGAVSEACALAMARGIRRAAKSDLGLAITGIAGPTGGSDEKPVGTVFISLATHEGEEARRFHFRGDRSRVRILSAISALDWLRRHMEGLKTT